MPDLFEEFRAEVVKFRLDGTRLIRAGRKNVEIGPIRSQVGDEVSAILVSKDKAICTNSEVVTSKYADYLDDLPTSPLTHVGTELPDTVIENISYPPSPFNEVSEISPGDGEFVASIDRISNTGNGIIETEDSHINIGPVKPGSIGETVAAKLEENGFARCFTEEIKKKNYEHNFKMIKRSNNSSDSNIKVDESTICKRCGLLLVAEQLPSKFTCEYINKSEKKSSAIKESIDSQTLTKKINKRDDSGNGLIKIEGTEINVGPVKKDAVAEEITVKLENNSFARCMTKQARVNHYELKYESIKNARGNFNIPIGKTINTEVIDIDSSGIGYVNTEYENDIIIGPISCEEGKEVEIEYLGNGYAYCNNKSIQSENYQTRLKILKGNYHSLPIAVGETYVGQIIKSYSSSSIANIDEVYVNLDNNSINIGEKVKVRITGFATQSAHGEIVEKLDSESEIDKSETSNNKEEDIGLYLIPVSDSWRDEFRNSVEKPLDLTQYDKLPSHLSEEDELRIWATTETNAANKQTAINQMQAGDCILFYHDGEFFAGGTVRRTFENPSVGKLIWNQRESRHIFIIENYTTEVPSITEVWNQIGYEGEKVVRGFSRVDEKRLSVVKTQFDSVEKAFLQRGIIEETNEDREKQVDAPSRSSESSPELTEEQVEYTESRRRTRDTAFTQKVREAYDEQCAICGSERQSPSGNPEVEAAHIYPKRKGGSDDVRNGIALCKLHHWAFDSGWLSITDNYEILIKDAPDCNGFEEFKNLEQKKIYLPDEDQAKPHPKFLKNHRNIYNFNSE